MKTTVIIVLAILINIVSVAAQKKPNSKSEPGKVVVADNKKGKDKPKGIVPDTGKVLIKREEKLEHRRLDSLYQVRIKLKDIEGIYIPKDLNDCFRELDKALDEEVKADFIALEDKEVDRRSHNTLGRWIEHRWSLLEGSRLSHYFSQMKVPHPDYMVGIILTSYHRYLNKKDLKLKEQVEFFRTLWQEKQRKEAKKIIDSGQVKAK